MELKKLPKLWQWIIGRVNKLEDRIQNIENVMASEPDSKKTDPEKLDPGPGPEQKPE